MARVGGVNVSESMLKKILEKSSKNKKIKNKGSLIERVVPSNNKSITKKEIANKLRERDDDLGWLDEMISKDREIILAMVTGKTTHIKSNHKKRIAELALKRSLYDGQQREHFIQVRLFLYVEENYPDFFDDMYAVPMGGYRPTKIGWEITAEGAKKGQPDLNIDFPNGGFFGLRLEVKSSIGVVSEVQEQKIERLNKRGFLAVVGRGYDECKKIIDDYFALE